MARKITQKELKHDEFVDAAFDFGHWLEEHWKTAATWAGVALALVLVGLGWMAWNRQRATHESERLAEGIDRYGEAQRAAFAKPEELTAALGEFDDASGPLATFYRGAALFRLGRLDEAQTALREVVSGTDSSSTLAAVAELMLARVQLQAGHAEDAIGTLEGLAARTEAAVPADQVLLELGHAYRAAGRDSDARARWQRIIDAHPNGSAAGEARVLLR